MNELIKTMQRLQRQGHVNVSHDQCRNQVRAAALAELRNLLNADLFALVELMNRPLLLVSAPVSGWWYAITGRGLRRLNANRVAEPHLGASVSLNTTWGMYSDSADLTVVYEILIGLNNGNPLVAYNKMCDSIRVFTIDGTYGSFMARRKSLY